MSEKQKWWYSQGKRVRAVYTANATQYDIINGETKFILCLVVEGELGYSPMRGKGTCATPWYWDSAIVWQVLPPTKYIIDVDTLYITGVVVFEIPPYPVADWL